MVDVPDTVECPCGNGYAERLSHTTVEEPLVGYRREIHSYRHTGCPVGGQLVVERNRVLRRAGPLFFPSRYNIGDAQTGPAAVATDGGQVVLE